MSRPAVLPLPFSRQVRSARELLKARRRAPQEEPLATGCPGLDGLLDGGLARGGLTELVGRRGSGRFSLVLAVLAAATAGGEAAALVDLGDGLDPQAAAAAGADLERLLWARPRDLKQTLASAEVILASGIPLVVLELGMPPLRGGRGAEAGWRRLARSAAEHRAALLVASPYRVSGTAARAVVETRERGASWHGRGAAPRLLRGVSTRLELVKARRQRAAEGGVEALRLRLAPALQSASHAAIVPFAETPESRPAATAPSPRRWATA